LPPANPPKRSIDDRWKVTGKPPAKEQKPSGKASAKTRQPSPPVDGVDAVILALISVCRERSRSWSQMTVSELAGVLRCSVGESSKRVKEAADGEKFVWAQRMGRQKVVGLHKIPAELWTEMCGSTPAVAVGLYHRHALSRRKRTEERAVPRGVIGVEEGTPSE
jgi:hypothetical protein